MVALRNGFPASFVPPPDLRPTAANDLRAEYFEPEGILPYDQSLAIWRLREICRRISSCAYPTWVKGEFISTPAKAVDLNPLDPSALVFRDRLNDLAFNQSLRPYPQFRSITPGYGYPIGSNSLHRGQLRIEKKFSYGLNFTGSYFFSKLIDDVLGGNYPQNNLDLKSEKSISPNDVTHQFSINYLYELPFGEGRAFLNQSNWLERHDRGLEFERCHQPADWYPCHAASPVQQHRRLHAGFASEPCARCQPTC